MTKSTENTMLVGLFIAFVVLFVMAWLDSKDIAIESGAILYADCIEAEYGGMSVEQVRKTFGEYPKCT